MRPRTALVLALLAFAAMAVAQLPWVRFGDRGEPDGYEWTLHWADGTPVSNVKMLRALSYERAIFSDQTTTSPTGVAKFYKPRNMGVNQGPPQLVELVAFRDGLISCAVVPGDKQGGSVTLMPTSRLRLHLVDSKGQPAAHVRYTPTSIHVDKAFVSLYYAGSLAAQTSDDQGVIEYAGLPRGVSLSGILDDDRFAQLEYGDQVTVGNGDTSEATLTLESGATFEGHAIDSITGEPVPWVVISAYSRMGSGALSKPTRSDGAYKISGLKQGLYTVQGRLAKPGKQTRVTTTLTGLSLAEGERKTGVDIKFVPGITISGKVTYRNTGNPAGSVQVGASIIGSGGGAEGFTKPDGTYEIVVPPGKYEMHALAPGHHEVVREQTVEVEATTKPISVDMTLPVEPFSKPVTGQVLSATGAPAPNAEVVTESENGPLVVKCDASGKFEIPKTVPAPAPLRARSGGDCTSGPYLATTADQPVTLKLSAKALASIQGKVVDAKGTPMPNARILVFELGSHPLLADLQTDAEGRYSVPSVWPNTAYVVFAQKKGYAEQSHQHVDVKPGEKKVLPALALMGLDRTLTGRVLNDIGDPVEGVVVSSGGGQDEKTAVTDKNGRFKLVGVPKEELHLHAELRNLDGWKTVAADGDDVIIIVKVPPRAAVKVPIEDLKALVGKPAPVLAVKQWLNGGTLDLSKHRGKLIVLNFWGTT